MPDGLCTPYVLYRILLNSNLNMSTSRCMGTEFILNLNIYYPRWILGLLLKGMLTMELKDRLFLALAAGRFTCGFCVLTAILFTTWLAENLGKTGLSLSQTFTTVGMAILTVVFARKAILKYTATIPYKILIWNSATFFIDAAVVYFVADTYPYVVLVSGVVSVMCDKAYLQSRKVLFNRVYSGDELTLTGNRLEIINIVAALGGSAVAMVVPATTTNIAIIILVADAVLTIANYYQIKYLLLLGGDGAEEFHTRVTAQRAAYRQAILDGKA